MITLLGVIGTQEIIILLFGIIVLFLIPVIAYQQGKKKGRLEGRLEEIEKNSKTPPYNR